ncbi:MAG TPA: SDR family oxidoreductase, partial [Alphaproteobacteria bacterium]|nr:SDR family oxidoreductase [Alphaproteobacteria bacterium]
LEEAAAVLKQRGAEVGLHAGDLREPAEAERLLASVRQRFGRLDILVNNAGATKRGDFFALSEADWQDGFALKFFAHVRLARAAWPLLKASQGSLLAIVGVGGRTPSADFTIGSTVNAGCLAFTKALADIGKRDGVQVNAINPGAVETDRLKRNLAALMAAEGLDEAAAKERFRSAHGSIRIGQPDDIAGLAAFILSAHGRWLHGAIIDMDGGQTMTL